MGRPAATVIVMGLSAVSSNLALRKLEAGPRKGLRSLNAFWGPVIMHALYRNILLGITSPFTFLFGPTTIAVFVGQAIGVWLWRRSLAENKQQ